MKKILLVLVMVSTMMVGPATAQMMGGGMMGGYTPLLQAQQNPPAAGYGMYPGMMGYGGYPNMMAYPSMMGQGGLYPGMMPYPWMMGQGGMYPGMMGYGPNASMMAYPGMMGQGWYPNMMVSPPVPGQGTSVAEKKFFEETVDLRKKAHLLMFEYAEAARDPKPDPVKLASIGKEILDLQKKIFDKWQEAAK